MNKKLFVAIMSLVMVFTFMPTLAFADTGSPTHGAIPDGWHWAEDGSSATYTVDGVTYTDVTVTSETTDPTCVDDGYTVFTAKWHNETDEKTIVDEDSALGHDWVMGETKVEKVNNSTSRVYVSFTCSRCNLVADSSKVEVNNSDATVVDPTCWEDGKAVFEARVKFEDQYYNITGERAKESLPSHDKRHLVEHHAAVPATCTEDGNLEYWYCTEDEKYFIEEAIDDKTVKVLVDSDGIVDPKTGHDYDVAYAFAADGSSCKAQGICKNCQDIVPENGTITSKVKIKPTCSTKGTTTYTATFTNEMFATQTKDVQDIPVDKDAHVFTTEYSWNGVKACRANATCAECNLAVIEDGVVTSETKDGVTTYTATFTKVPFETQTKVVENPNPMKVKIAKKQFKATYGKKTVFKKAIVVTEAVGKVTYAKVKGNKKITVAKKTGKVTVKKGLKKGTYTVKVKVSASGSNEVMPGVKVVTLKIKVK